MRTLILKDKNMQSILVKKLKNWIKLCRINDQRHYYVEWTEEEERKNYMIYFLYIWKTKTSLT